MPILKVKISGPRRADTNAQVVRMLMDATQDVLGKKRDLIAIAIDYVEPDDWFVAGRSLQDWGKASFYLDIKITDETNTKSEKGSFIERVFSGFTEILGQLHEESYIHVEDVRAAAYGYGGRTQEYRYQHPAE